MSLPCILNAFLGTLAPSVGLLSPGFLSQGQWIIHEGKSTVVFWRCLQNHEFCSSWAARAATSIRALLRLHQGKKKKIIVIIIKGEQILSVIHYRWVWALGMITLIYSSLKAGPESSTSGLKIFQTRLSAKPVSKTWRLLMVRPTMMTAPRP